MSAPGILSCLIFKVRPGRPPLFIMPAQPELASQNLSFHPSISTTYNQHTMTGTSYAPNDPGVSSQDLDLLAHEFSQQSLRPDSRNVANARPPSGSVSYHQPVPQQHTNTSQSRPQTTASVRSQRQANTRTQCLATRARQLSSLLQHMVDTGEQCSVCPPTSRREPSAPPWLEAEQSGATDFAGEEATAEPSMPGSQLIYRRSSDSPVNAQNYVAKKVRARKKKPQSEGSRVK